MSISLNMSKLLDFKRPAKKKYLHHEVSRIVDKQKSIDLRLIKFQILGDELSKVEKDYLHNVYTPPHTP